MSFYDEFNYDLLNNETKQSGGATVNKTFGNGKIGYPDDTESKRKPYFKRKKNEEKEKLIEEEIYDMKETMFLSELPTEPAIQDSTIEAMLNRKVIFERDYDLRFTDIEDDKEKEKKSKIDKSNNFETYSVLKQNALTLKLSNALNDYDDLNKEVEELENIYDICNNPFDIIYDASANSSIKKKKSIEKIISEKYYIDHIAKNFETVESQQTTNLMKKKLSWKTKNQRIKDSGLYKPVGDEIKDDSDSYYNKYKKEVEKKLTGDKYAKTTKPKKENSDEKNKRINQENINKKAIEEVKNHYKKKWDDELKKVKQGLDKTEHIKGMFNWDEGWKFRQSVLTGQKNNYLSVSKKYVFVTDRDKFGEKSREEDIIKNPDLVQLSMIAGVRRVDNRQKEDRVFNYTIEKTHIRAGLEQEKELRHNFENIESKQKKNKTKFRFRNKSPWVLWMEIAYVKEDLSSEKFKGLLYKAIKEIIDDHNDFIIKASKNYIEEIHYEILSEAPFNILDEKLKEAIEKGFDGDYKDLFEFDFGRDNTLTQKSKEIQDIVRKIVEADMKIEELEGEIKGEQAEEAKIKNYNTIKANVDLIDKLKENVKQLDEIIKYDENEKKKEQQEKEKQEKAAKDNIEKTSPKNKKTLLEKFKIINESQKNAYTENVIAVPEFGEEDYIFKHYGVNEVHVAVKDKKILELVDEEDKIKEEIKNYDDEKIDEDVRNDNEVEDSSGSDEEEEEEEESPEEDLLSKFKKIYTGDVADFENHKQATQILKNILSDLQKGREHSVLNQEIMRDHKIPDGTSVKDTSEKAVEDEMIFEILIEINKWKTEMPKKRQEQSPHKTPNVIFSWLKDTSALELSDFKDKDGKDIDNWEHARYDYYKNKNCVESKCKLKIPDARQKQILEYYNKQKGGGPGDGEENEDGTVLTILFKEYVKIIDLLIAQKIIEKPDNYDKIIAIITKKKDAFDITKTENPTEYWQRIKDNKNNTTIIPPWIEYYKTKNEVDFNKKLEEVKAKKQNLLEKKFKTYQKGLEEALKKFSDKTKDELKYLESGEYKNDKEKVGKHDGLDEKINKQREEKQTANAKKQAAVKDFNELIETLKSTSGGGTLAGKDFKDIIKEFKKTIKSDKAFITLKDSVKKGDRNWATIKRSFLQLTKGIDLIRLDINLRYPHDKKLKYLNEKMLYNVQEVMAEIEFDMLHVKKDIKQLNVDWMDMKRKYLFPYSEWIGSYGLKESVWSLTKGAFGARTLSKIKEGGVKTKEEIIKKLSQAQKFKTSLSVPGIADMVNENDVYVARYETQQQFYDENGFWDLFVTEEGEGVRMTGKKYKYHANLITPINRVHNKYQMFFSHNSDNDYSTLYKKSIQELSKNLVGKDHKEIKKILEDHKTDNLTKEEQESFKQKREGHHYYSGSSSRMVYNLAALYLLYKIIT